MADSRKARVLKNPLTNSRSTKTSSAEPSKNNREPSSFRDNHGYVFWSEGTIYRAILADGESNFAQLKQSSLLKALVEANLLLEYQELPAAEARKLAPDAKVVIRPRMVPLISYPYEWSWSQLRGAALATLQIQKIALEHNMSLRDASAYNIQFLPDGVAQPQFIDTLSFEPLKPKQPWIAYQQFCQHFLAPLALASYCDVDLMQLSRVYIDGIPLPLAASLLPRRSRFKIGLATHIVAHARLQTRHQADGAGGTKPKQPANLSAHALVGLLDSLERTIRKLPAPSKNTEWANYYAKTNYDDKATEAKAKVVAEFCAKVKPKRVLDLGANDGRYSRVAATNGNVDLVVSADIDPSAVEHNYLEKHAKIIPILIDLTNPSPAIGWNNQERASFQQRAKSDLVLALALIHHLAIANNVPLEMIAEYCANLAPNLVIEFVPKDDSQVQKLLATREDIFDNYTKSGFEAAFGQFFTIRERQQLPHSKRVIYLMKRKNQ